MLKSVRVLLDIVIDRESWDCEALSIISNAVNPNQQTADNFNFLPDRVRNPQRTCHC